MHREMSYLEYCLQQDKKSKVDDNIVMQYLRRELERRRQKHLFSPALAQALLDKIDSGMSLSAMAKECGIHDQTMYNYTSGVNKFNPGNPILKKICAYLGISEEDALGAKVVKGKGKP